MVCRIRPGVAKIVCSTCAMYCTLPADIAEQKPSSQNFHSLESQRRTFRCMLYYAEYRGKYTMRMLDSQYSI